MQIIKIDNNLQSFNNEITRLKSEHPNLAFISFIQFAMVSLPTEKLGTGFPLSSKPT